MTVTKQDNKTITGSAVQPKLLLRCEYHHILNVLHIFAQLLFRAGTQGYHQNWVPYIVPYKYGLIFMGVKQKWPTQKK